MCSSLVRTMPAVLLASYSLSNVAQSIGPECPRAGTLELVEDTSLWADNCFAATTGRYPDPGNVGESRTFHRDIDLDGIDEVLELRGTGNVTNPIYVFKRTNEGHLYLGRLTANSSLEVVRGESGTPTLQYMHRFFTNDVQPIQIQYINNEFVTIQDLETEEVYQFLETKYERETVEKFECTYSDTEDLWYCFKPSEQGCIDCTIHQHVFDRIPPEFPSWQLMDG